MDNPAISLYQLLGQVKSAVKNNLPQAWWIIAEISELKVNYSGHCYLELIEKESAGESIKARARATIWSSVFRMLQPYFETTTQTRLSSGMKVLVKVTAEFHELYGFSLNISDIEPSFTLGELERQKQEIIKRLIAEGIFDMNRSLPMPELPRKVAVISSRTAAGLGDFMDQLGSNPFGYKFYLKLFPAVMQGDEAESSITDALDRIYGFEDFFDVVVIIRGGGAQSELNCFNSYWLAAHICQFPLPVFTGIGHEQDETIADLVAHTRLKTPTAVAEFLLDHYRQADDRINELSMTLSDLVTDRVNAEHERLKKFFLLLKPAVKEFLATTTSNLRYLHMNITRSSGHLLIRESAKTDRKIIRLKTVARQLLLKLHHQLEVQEKRNGYLDPYLILKRGYSVTYHQGRVVKNPATVPNDTLIETRLAKGTLKSKTI